MAREISEEAIIKATGSGKDHWYPILEEYAKDAKERKEITMRMWHQHSDVLSAWWAQMITVTWERDTNRRVMNQSCLGSFQLSASKTMPGDENEVWQRMMDSDWLAGSEFSEGNEFESEGVRCVVRAVRPGKLLRFWWYGHEDEHKSVVEIMLYPKAEKCSLRFRHHDLPFEEDVAPLREKWKQALAVINQS